jgi:hypothetical protein
VTAKSLSKVFPDDRSGCPAIADRGAATHS